MGQEQAVRVQGTELAMLRDSMETIYLVEMAFSKRMLRQQMQLTKLL
jgi:hypothetical protein